MAYKKVWNWPHNQMFLAALKKNPTPSLNDRPLPISLVHLFSPSRANAVKSLVRLHLCWSCFSPWSKPWSFQLHGCCLESSFLNLSPDCLFTMESVGFMFSYMGEWNSENRDTSILLLWKPGTGKWAPLAPQHVIWISMFLLCHP